MPERPEIVIDGDGHICEPELVWTEYTRAAYRDRVLQVRRAGLAPRPKNDRRH